MGRIKMSSRATQALIAKECLLIQDMLLEKNRKYGNSAIEPLRIFSKADPIEQINVRIDDKLSRITSAQTDDDEDPELDLIGYLILKRVARHAVIRGELKIDGSLIVDKTISADKLGSPQEEDWMPYQDNAPSEVEPPPLEGTFAEKLNKLNRRCQ